MNSRWIVVNQQTTDTIVVSSSYSMQGSFNHLANCQNEAVTEAYFFLNKSEMTHANHMSPKATKKKGTMLAANTSMDTLSIQFT